MAGLISEEEAAVLRSDLRITLTHTYTRTPTVDGPPDGRYESTSVPGTPVGMVPCKVKLSTRVRSDDGGVVLVDRSIITVEAVDPLAPGDKVSDILNAANIVIERGPFTVGKRLDSDPLGLTLLKKYELLGAKPLEPEAPPVGAP